MSVLTLEAKVAEAPFRTLKENITLRKAAVPLQLVTDEQSEVWVNPVEMVGSF